MNYTDEPKKPTQVPPGDLSDAIGTHEEVPYDSDDGDEDYDDEEEE